VGTRAVSHALVSTLSAVLNPLHMPPPDAAAARLRQAQCAVCRTVRGGGTAAGRDAAGVAGAAGADGPWPRATAGGMPLPAGWASVAAAGVAGGVPRAPVGRSGRLASERELCLEALRHAPETALAQCGAGAPLSAPAGGWPAGAGGAPWPLSGAAPSAPSAETETAGGAGIAAGAGGVSGAWPWDAGGRAAATGAGAAGVSESIACYLCERGTGSERAADAFVTQQLAHGAAEYYGGYYARYADKAHAALAPPPKEAAA